MRRVKKTGVGLLVTALFAAVGLTAQHSSTIPVIIRVNDSVGAIVAHAHVSLRPSPENAAAKLETGISGRLSLNLRVGGYALSVSAPGFKTWSERIFVSSPEVNTPSQIVPVVLQIGEVSDPHVIYAADTLVLTGDSDHALVLSSADFRLLPHISATVHNSHTNASEVYSGVPLATLLAKIGAPLGKDLRGATMTSYMIARGSDGYSVVLSLAEVDPSFHRGQVLVADTRDGQPLGKNGPFQLIVTDDKRPARWVHNLQSITLQAAH